MMLQKSTSTIFEMAYALWKLFGWRKCFTKKGGKTWGRGILSDRLFSQKAPVILKALCLIKGHGPSRWGQARSARPSESF